MRERAVQLFFAPGEAVIVLAEPPKSQTNGPLLGGRSPRRFSSPALAHVMRMKLIGANPLASISGEEPLPGKMNYFIGNDPAAWHTNIPTFAKVRYREIYPGIDLVYYGSEGRLEYDFVVAPGADPNRIQMLIEGADEVQPGPEADLRCVVAGRTLCWGKPHVFQQADGRQQLVSSTHVIEPDPTAPGTYRESFAVGPHNPGLALVIDPVLAYSTFLGGGLQDGANGIAVDSQGSVYVAGLTISPSGYIPFPTTTNSVMRSFKVNGAAFVTKFSPEGNSLIYSTVLAGKADAQLESQASALKLDGQDQAIIAGFAVSDFPIRNAAQLKFGGGDSDAFIAKLSPDGASLVFSTFLGGSQDESISAIDLDSAGNIYPVGFTTSSNDFPVLNAAQPAVKPGTRFASFAAKLAADGSRFEYVTYLNADFALNAMAVSPDGHAYVTRGIRTDNDSEVILTRVSPGGDAFDYSTTNFLGGAAFVSSMVLDQSGNLFLTGSTTSSSLAATPNAFSSTFLGGPNEYGTDAYIAKFNPAGSNLVYLTYLGGSDNDSGNAIAVDASGNAYIAGMTMSTDFPVLDPIQAKLSPQGPTDNAAQDAFVCKLNPAGSALLWSSYFGGSGGGNPAEGEDVANAVALGSGGSVYVAGITRELAPVIRRRISQDRTRR